MSLAILQGVGGGGSQPTLITKSITQNGTYNASADNADGYSSVNVNVPPTLFRKLVDRSITQVTADDLAGLTSIGTEAFYQCFDLLDVTIPDSVITIGLNAFAACTSLENITIGNGVTTIVEYAFQGCGSLTGIILPSSVTSIGEYAFRNCNHLTSFIINATTPPTLTGSNAFNGTNNCPIYVPTPDDYKAATNWSALSSRIFPLVSTVADLTNIDTTTYTKACVRGSGTYDEYTYDGSSWNLMV